MDPDPELEEKYFPLSSSSWSPEELRKRIAQSNLVKGSGNALAAAYKYIPILEWLPLYSWRANAAKDCAGAATLGCILVAQSLAHADLCKVALICGPYGCILPPVLYSLFGTCIHSSVGTGGLVSLLTGEQLMKYSNSLEERTRAGAVFTLLVGLVIALMGAFRLAFLVRFLSRPALSGFITASAILIIVSQMKPMIGLPKADTGGLMQIAKLKPWEFKDFSPATVLLSIVCLAFLFNAKKLAKLHRRLKFLGDFKELSLLVVTAIACRHTTEEEVQKVGEVPSGLPRLELPPGWHDLALIQELLPGAILVALVTFLSSFAGAKKFAMMAGYQIVAINELIALGAANLGGALCGAVPTQIGLSRMGIAYSAGVKSQLGANVYVAIIVASVLMLFSTYLQYVPRCVLNAIIVAGAYHLLEFDHMFWLWSLRSTRTRQRTYLVDFAVWWVACASTLYFGALKGIVGAVLVSLFLIIYQVADPPISLLGWAEAKQRWMAVKAFSDARPRAGILAFRIDGPLFYANIERVQEWLAEMEVVADHDGSPLRGIVLSAAAMPFVDTTALDALRQTIVAYHQRGINFLVSNATGQPKRIFEHEIAHLLPKDSLSHAWETKRCVQYLVSEEHRRQEELKVTEISLPLTPAAPVQGEAANTAASPAAGFRRPHAHTEADWTAHAHAQEQTRKALSGFSTAPGPLADLLSLPKLLPAALSESLLQGAHDDATDGEADTGATSEIRPLLRQVDWLSAHAPQRPRANSLPSTGDACAPRTAPASSIRDGGII